MIHQVIAGDIHRRQVGLNAAARDALKAADATRTLAGPEDTAFMNDSVRAKVFTKAGSDEKMLSVFPSPGAVCAT